MKTSPISFAGSVKYQYIDQTLNEEDKAQLDSYKPMIDAAAKNHEIEITGYDSNTIYVYARNDDSPDKEHFFGNYFTFRQPLPNADHIKRNKENFGMLFSTILIDADMNARKLNLEKASANLKKVSDLSSLNLEDLKKIVSSMSPERWAELVNGENN